MTVRKHRLEKGWSQEQLAHMSGLSVRTIQRIEQGQKAGLESLKCLAAVFETNISELIEDEPMQEKHTPSKKMINREEEKALEYVKELKGFHINWLTYVVVIPALYLLNVFISPEYLWVVWPALGWGLGVGLHAVTLFGISGIFSPEWEQRQFEKRLRR
ncbi:MAG: 2TM domain-containing protein [Emcibacteraceae bacterium]|nr:2TM domain-containing protein [Emcibacteraceae bacterium]MDG1857693.1 2TM domain-containing protein [Emcibacteraceae bacterium]